MDTAEVVYEFSMKSVNSDLVQNSRVLIVNALDIIINIALELRRINLRIGSRLGFPSSRVFSTQSSLFLTSYDCLPAPIKRCNNAAFNLIEM